MVASIKAALINAFMNMRCHVKTGGCNVTSLPDFFLMLLVVVQPHLHYLHFLVYIGKALMNSLCT